MWDFLIFTDTHDDDGYYHYHNDDDDDDGGGDKNDNMIIMTITICRIRRAPPAGSRQTTSIKSAREIITVRQLCGNDRQSCTARANY